MALFGSDKQEGAPAQPAGPGQVPVQEVVNMKNQGLTNNQIIQNLQREGYKSHQIFDAMNQADLHLSQGAGGAPAEAAPQQPAAAPPQQSPADPQVSPYYQNDPAQPWPGSEQQPPQQQAAPPQQPPQQPHDPFSVPVDKVPPAEDPLLGQPGMGQQQQPAPAAPMTAPLTGPAEEDSVDRIEEVAEAIIDEKWSELMKHIQKVIDWKGRVDSRIVEMENKFKGLEAQFDKLHESIIGKIEEYDENIRDVGTEMKGMEKVFQKIIPELSSNVAELSKLTDTIKDDTKKKKKK